MPAVYGQITGRKTLPAQITAAMILISNQQRDQIVKYLESYCNQLQGSDTRTYNTKRLASILVRRLRAKHPVDAAKLKPKAADR